MIGTIRRECLDHLIVVNERHLRRVLREFVAYYNRGRVFRSPSAAGKAVTRTATNGYRFWSIPDKPPAGQAARQQAAQAAAEKAA